MCKRGDTFSLAVLIGRGLDLALLLLLPRCFFRSFVQFSGYTKHAEKHLLFLRFCVILPIVQQMAVRLSWRVGVISDEGPPVPIPNTVVKLICAEDTWWEAAWKNRSVPTQTLLVHYCAGSVNLIYYLCHMCFV